MPLDKASVTVIPLDAVQSPCRLLPHQSALDTQYLIWILPSNQQQDLER